VYESLAVVTLPTTTAVDLATVKLQCRVDVTDTTEDALLNLYIAGVTMAVEAYLKRTLLTTQYCLTRDLLPNSNLGGPTSSVAFNVFLNTSAYPYTLDGVFRLLKPPLVSVDKVEYQDTSGTWQTLDPSFYAVVPGFPGRIAPAYGKIWPFTLPQIGSVRITYTAGQASVPANIQIGILLWVASLYKTREPISEGSMMEVPWGLRAFFDTAYAGSYR
jgi:hypothetical protein